MIKKGLLVTVIVSAAIVFMFFISSNKAAAKRKPLDYQVQYKADLSKDDIKAKLKAGWQLGAIYPDCGEGFGEVEVTADVPGALLPFYKKLLEKTKKEMLQLLTKTQPPSKAKRILNNIIAGKEKLTKHGGLPEYGALQERFDKINSIMAEITSTPAEGAVATIEELVEKLEKFLKSPSTTEVNAAKKAVQTLGMIIEKYPENFMANGKSVEDNLVDLERIRKAVKDSLAKVKEEGTGCKMVHVFYRTIK